MRIWLDMDGVLADFDQGFKKITGFLPHHYRDLFGEDKFWEFIEDTEKTKGFFSDLPEILDGRKVYNIVEHFRPIILTGCPLGNWSQKPKVIWGELHYPGVPVVTTKSQRKSIYCYPGDILIDDRTKYADSWIEAGGVFLHFQGYESVKDELVRRLAL